MSIINPTNLMDALLALEFVSVGHTLVKVVGGVQIVVDLKQKKIIYPEIDGLTVHDQTVCNFSASENFVVLECVTRLLMKGYKASHIELEPRWRLGHGASGGKADILLKDHLNNPLLIIECKTPGHEFDRAWAKTNLDGGQLFSYAQQVSSVQYLCLYASAINGSKIEYKAHLIPHIDNSEYLSKNPHLSGFSVSTSVENRFKTWKDTYKQEFLTKGLFESDIEAYSIGKTRYTLSDLSIISQSNHQSKYHEFATILRQHNVSGRENAFDKLVNLLLCKIVDELQNPGDLKFFWKGAAYDNAFDLIDRLQKLYQSGMATFLGEDITYISQEHVNKALRFYHHKADATMRAVWDLFVQQKFFTNNDFAFIDVHNEGLFRQNADVLIKIIRMWQDIRLTEAGKYNQFLGDLFEGFLDQGVRQSEGQFFTPMPICRFLVSSLPLENILSTTKTPPKALDYACGAGHFLTELAHQLQILVQDETPVDMSPYYASIMGIEKEYRLSKVSKVAAFMHGYKEVQICYGDGLLHTHEAYPAICDESFDVLVANPPYSVRGFLETLSAQDRARYELTETVSDAETAAFIETFFIERAKQVLKAGGVAAIITPAALLTNSGGAYIRAREVLLKFFDIVGIVELGSGTFGKTGTNTVTLFLRRRNTKPDDAVHLAERVDEWFSSPQSPSRKRVIYKDDHLIAEYAAHIDVPCEAYIKLLRGIRSSDWEDCQHFQPYWASFAKSTERKQLVLRASYKGKTPQEQQDIMSELLLKFVRRKEREKLYYFILTHSQKSSVFIVRSPHSKKEHKEFLGYEWNGAKGSEGIKLVQDADGRHLTPLYEGPADDDLGINRRNPDKINHYLLCNFEGCDFEIPEELLTFCKTARLADMLSFNEDNFDKGISLSANATVEFNTKWPKKRLGQVSKLNPSKKGLSLSPKDKVGFVEMASVSEHGFIEKIEEVPFSDVSKRSLTYFADGDILVAKITPCMENGKCGIVNGLPNAIGFGSTEFHVVRTDNSVLLPGYALSLLNRSETRVAAAQNMTGSSGHRRVPERFYETLQIPIPSLDVQMAIAEECEAVDTRVREAHAAMTNAKSDAEALCAKMHRSGFPKATIGSLGVLFEYGLSTPLNEAGSGYKTFRMNEIINLHMVDSGKMKRSNVAEVDFLPRKLEKGDLLFNRTNSIEHVGKTGIFDLDGEYTFASYLYRIRCNITKVLPRFLLAMMNSSEFLLEARAKASRSINQANINPTVMRSLSIPLPPIPEQKKFVKAWQSEQSKLDHALKVVSEAERKKQAVLDSYL